MLEFLYNIPFLVLEPPNLKLKRISIPVPSAKTIFFVVLLSYFLVCAGELEILFLFIFYFILPSFKELSMTSSWSRLQLEVQWRTDTQSL